MKKPVTLIGACFVFSGLQAQIKMYSNGNVGIQSSAVPEAALVVGGNASNKGTGFKTYIQSNGYVLNVRREGAWGSASPWLVASEGNNLVDGDDFYIGVKGIAMPSTPLGNGRAWGVKGEAGNSTNGYNYAVHGNLRGSQRGAAILGTLDNVDINVPGRYTGYFLGDIRATGNIYGTVLTPSASGSALTGRAAVMPLSVENNATNGMSVTEKLSRLTAVQYNLSEPQAAQAFAAAGDGHHTPLRD